MVETWINRDLLLVYLFNFLKWNSRCSKIAWILPRVKYQGHIWGQTQGRMIPFHGSLGMEHEYGTSVELRWGHIWSFFKNFLFDHSKLWVWHSYHGNVSVCSEFQEEHNGRNDTWFTSQLVSHVAQIGTIENALVFRNPRNNYCL